jgi:hypothetical protein
MCSSGNEDGVYFVPLMPAGDTPAHEDWQKEFKRGPRAVVIYNTGEVELSKFIGLSMVKGFLVMLASCFLVAVMLGNARIGHFMGRWTYCVTFGAIITIFSQGSQWAWFSAPLGWTIPAMVNDVVAWACAGLVMGAMIKPS